MEDKAHKVVACDYFIAALDDPTLEHKIREKVPTRMGVAYKEVINLEMWQHLYKSKAICKGPLLM